VQDVTTLIPNNMRDVKKISRPPKLIVTSKHYQQPTLNKLKHQYSETKLMSFFFNLLRIKGLYMFRALLAHLQEALHKRRLIYCVLVMSVGYTRIEASWCSQLT
jgi:hypothetical protein